MTLLTLREQFSDPFGIARCVLAGGTVTGIASNPCRFPQTRYARRFTTMIGEVHDRELAVTGSAGPVTEAVAGGLHKLMAYKDEYEVARLSLDPALVRAIRREFGDQTRFAFKLHPPLLRALGVRRKISLHRPARPAFLVLRALRRLRGTPFDLFGHTVIRRTERQLPGEYIDAVRSALAALQPGNAAAIAELAALPDLVRGYENIKLTNVETYRAALRDALTALGSPLQRAS